MAEVYVAMTDGTEESEALLMVDLLRRAEIPTETVAVAANESNGLEEKQIQSLHGVIITCDRTLEEVKHEDVNVWFLPGGRVGVKNFAASTALKEVLSSHQQKNRQLVAVCAGPSVLGEFGLVKGKNVTVFPGFEAPLKDANVKKDPIVADEHVLTGNGLGASMELAFALIAALRDTEAAEQVKAQIQYREK